jgi:tellurite resistance protein TerC
LIFEYCGTPRFEFSSSIRKPTILSAPGTPLLLFWILFNLFALAMLVLDLRIFHRRSHVVRLGEALGWGAIWITLAAVFAGVIYFWQGHQVALEFVTGYFVELSLSVDNLFVFLVIFRYFAVPPEQQYRVLFWGILGAILLRGVFIGVGVGLIHRFHWIFYVLGMLLIYSGVRFLALGEHQREPSKNSIVSLLRRLISVTPEYHGAKFLVRLNDGGLRATPLLLALLAIEATDVFFAADSIPAVLGITLNAFIVYTSNVFAILGLRSMYFAISGLMKVFRFLHYGLAIVLMLVGVKMLVAKSYPISTSTMLCVVLGVLTVSIVASALVPAQPE